VAGPAEPAHAFLARGAEELGRDPAGAVSPKPFPPSMVARSTTPLCQLSRYTFEGVLPPVGVPLPVLLEVLWAAGRFTGGGLI
jgi:hypothetical protein